jgi:Protein O-mannosyl-transferase TMEM260-like
VTSESSRRLLSRFDLALAGAAAVASLAVYVATLAPGLIAITDTPKFQFIGRILGTAHPPGYPLYVMVSHVFGYLPIGSLAYRINLMSAVFSAAACGLLVIAARLLGVGRAASVAAALSFAFGSAVWYVSTIAEVYALNSFFVAAIVTALFAWGRTNRAVWFYAAVALVGISLGNHTTTVFMIPATAVCACLAAPRFALRPRTIAASAAIVAAALTQYLFIVVRNQQGAWGEAPAWNLTQLAQVVAGAQYYSDVMPNGFGGFLATIVPAVGTMFMREMSAAGLAISALGIVVLWERAKPALALLLVALAGYAGFAAAYTPKEFEVFLIPAFVMAWLLAAAGADWLIRVVRERRSQVAAAMLSTALFVAPAWQLSRNHVERDMSHATGDMRFFDALFERLPARSAILHEDFLIDRMVYYKTLGEDAARGKDLRALVDAGIGPVRQASIDQYQVFAFTNAARMMRLLDGAEFSYAPYDLRSGTIERYLDDLPRGAIVAVGVPASLVASFARDRRMPLDAIGFSRRLTAIDASGGLALVGERGGPSTEAPQDPAAVHVNFPPASAKTASVREMIAVSADRDGASIEFGGREILRTTRGMAIAVWTRDGLSAAFVVAPGLAPPPPPTPYAIYPLRGLQEPRAIGSEPVDLTHEASSGAFVYKANTGVSRLVIYAGRSRPLSPSLHESSARSWPAFDVREFSSPADLTRALEQDGMAVDNRLRALPHVYRIAIDTNWSTPAGTQIGMGGIPEVVYGRLIEGRAGEIYGVDLLTHLARIDDRTLSLHMARDHHAQLVGAGWSDVVADAVGSYRETTRAESELLIPIDKPATLRIGIELIALGDGDAAPKSVRLRFNGETLDDVAPARVWRRNWWSVPAGAVVHGVNSMSLIVEPAAARIAVSDVLVELEQ